ncbi:hypothetical protein A4X06_0g8916 [Tilletia controversa]|uniref:Reverse transcriptase domain-containing protein n=1 Tax=Tilletia controversa TaxID=13291 RepID=A0A8X7MJG0_9BASI|nr:hypothetical protein A4X06_0g8916 [Tilletia controversa]
MAAPFFSSASAHCNPCSRKWIVVALRIASPALCGAVRDVANAFRLVPLHPSQWPGIVVRGLDDRFYIDQFLGFGLAPATGVWGRVADALADILRAHGIGPILKWVDDFLFLSVPLQDLPLVNQLRRQAAESIVERRTRGGVAYFADGEGKEHVEDYHFPLQNLSALRPTELVTSLSTISAISDPLGIPWKSEKDVDFCSAPVYIGFTWYIAERCVALPDSKRLKYLAALADWGQQPRQNLRAAQKLFGRLQHASFVVQQGRKRLGYLRRFVASLSHLSPHQRHRPGKQVAKDMAWWTSALSRPDLRRSFAKDDVFDKRFVACDASTTHGIGVVVDGAELFIPVTIGTRPSWRHSRVSVISKRHTTLKWYPSWFPARQTLPMDPLEVVAPHLRNFVVQVSIPQYGRSLDDRTWGALQPILSSTFASTSTSRATSFAPASAPRPPLPPPPARPPTTPPASASAATRTTSKRRLPVAAGGYLEVPAALRLLDWVPPGSSLLSARDPQQRRRVLAAAWAESTLATYGTGLLRWLLWCEQHALPASARFPAHVGDVVDFIESVAGHFSGGSIRNWVSGLRAWHAIHGSALDTVHLRIVTALRGADRLTPESSKKPPRAPFRLHHLWAIRRHVQPDSPLDSAVWACILVAFWGLARLGELLVKNGKSFNKRWNPPSAKFAWETAARTNPPVIAGVISLPWTKTQANGEKLVLAPQTQGPCPVQALQHHLHINKPPAASHLFGYYQGKKFVSLTRSVFQHRLSELLAAAGIAAATLQGHSLRIGGCTELLLRGTPIDTVRLHGRWTSEAWRLYLRNHVELLAPALMDARPAVAVALVHATQPPPPAYEANETSTKISSSSMATLGAHASSCV